jgi:hypothetical protein
MEQHTMQIQYSANKANDPINNRVCWIIKRDSVELGYYVWRSKRGFEIAMIDQVFEGLGAVVNFIAELEGDSVS